MHNFSKCVPIDHLLGPLIVACGKTAGNNATKTHVYYDGPGAAPEEFEYVIDSLFRYQVITNQTSIDMVLAEPNARASVHFQTARERYARDKWHTISPQQETSTTMVNNISYRSLPTQARRIYEVEIGL